MPAPPKDPARLRVAHLNRRAAAEIDLAPDAAARAALAADLDLLDLPALRLTGHLLPEGSEGWRLEARLVADVVQPCVVTLAPVPAHLEEEVRRVYSPHAPTQADGEPGETEMGDADLEPLGAFIDLGAVLAEELSLALPLYPRADAAGAPPATDPDTAGEERRRPFADLGQMLAARGKPAKDG